MTEATEIPVGLCQCGCGKKTPLARQTSTKWGWVRGQPVKYIQHHHLRDAAQKSSERSRERAGIPKDAARNKHGHSCVERECVACGEKFLVQWSERSIGTRKTCSHACAGKLKRESETYKDRKGTKNPNYRGGNRTGVRDREGERRWYAAMGLVCQHPSCPRTNTRLALHHCLYRQHLVREGGDLWDPRNALTLCSSCHTSHHQRGRVIPVSALPDAVLAFARELLGLAAYDYFVRRYADDGDERLDELLQEGEAA